MLRDRTDVTSATRPGHTTSERGVGAVRKFMEHHYRHFNARETLAAARAYEAHIEAGGKMLMTLAGAMSTAQLGVILARMIREDKVHAISCTGANLEEDVFNLLAKPRIRGLPGLACPFRGGRAGTLRSGDE